CVTNSNTNACDLTDQNGVLPVNAKWNNSNTFTQSWNGSTWLPATKKASYNEVPGECNYSCKETSKNCTPNKETYCGNGISECVEGDWGTCIPTQATICTQNQYCDNTNSCAFCATGTKNCDSNLLTGCESVVNNDPNNCGTCGNVCASGQSCVSGVCGGTIIDNNNPPPVDVCENVTCETNQYCYDASCLCTPGFYNCDNDLTNGCETFGGCEILTECTNDNECNSEEECKDNSCITKTTGQRCFVTNECSDDEYCTENNVCALVACGENFIAKDHFCDCSGTVCDNTCYPEQGSCCNGIWNTKTSSCTYPTSSISDLANNSNDSEAIALITEAEKLILEGKVNEGKAKAKLAELKANITTSGQTDLLETYYEARQAIESGDYDQAELLITTANDDIKQNNTSGGIDLVPIAIVIIIILAFVFFLIKAKKVGPFAQDQEESDDYQV
ncbi:hypothetical protein HN803_02995, partial [candidate division WWE3 bacterium]|nr:hypothetical protein [candidate division WWE3 bacterium]